MVKVELQQGGRERWAFLLGLAAMMVLAGLGLRTWSSRGAPASEGHHEKGSEQERRAAVSGGSRSPKSAAPGAAARPDVATRPAPPGAIAGPEATVEPESEGPNRPERPETRSLDGQEQAGQEQAGQERTGTRLFPAPGTKRIKPGIIVPDDFALPPGYVRHFQTTDKGQMLEAILMFHPDYKPLSADGSPVPLPADRVVPPEMAPAGLPVKLLEVPADAYADTEESSPNAAP